MSNEIKKGVLVDVSINVSCPECDHIQEYMGHEAGDTTECCNCQTSYQIPGVAEL